jgi:hypothetical protein
MAHGVRKGWKLAAVRRRPVVRGRSGGRLAAPRRRPRADLPTLPQTVRGRAAARSASSPRRADSGCRRRDRAVARRAPHRRPTFHRLGPRLEVPRQGSRGHRAASPGRCQGRWARLPWRRPADRAPQRRLCVLTALPHVAAGRPPCVWGPLRIYCAARPQSCEGRVAARGTQHPIVPRGGYRGAGRRTAKSREGPLKAADPTVSAAAGTGDAARIHVRRVVARVRRGHSRRRDTRQLRHPARPVDHSGASTHCARSSPARSRRGSPSSAKQGVGDAAILKTLTVFRAILKRAELTGRSTATRSLWSPRRSMRPSARAAADCAVPRRADPRAHARAADPARQARQADCDARSAAPRDGRDRGVAARVRGLAARV